MNCIICDVSKYIMWCTMTQYDQDINRWVRHAWPSINIRLLCRASGQHGHHVVFIVHNRWAWDEYAVSIKFVLLVLASRRRLSWKYRFWWSMMNNLHIHDINKLENGVFEILKEKLVREFIIGDRKDIVFRVFDTQKLHFVHLRGRQFWKESNVYFILHTRRYMRQR